MSEIIFGSIVYEISMYLYENKMPKSDLKNKNTSLHLELIKRSTEYVGVTQNPDEIDALLTEINQLKLDNLRLQQQLDELNS